MRLPGSLSSGAVVGIAAVAVLGATGGVLVATHSSHGHGGGGSAAQADKVQVAPTSVVLMGLRHGHVPWNKRVQIRVVNGRLRSVALSAGGSASIDGTLSAGDTRWTSAQTLVPLTSYRVTIGYVDSAKHAQSKQISFAAADSSKHLKVTLSPADGDVVGVGSPVIASFSRPVPDSKRAAVEARLAVVTKPAVSGAWHWMGDQEVHWRPPTYWKRHTRVTISADLTGLYLGKGIWGAGSHRTSFRIGDSHVSRVDVARHVMYVYDNGALVRTFPISAGRDKYPTKNGVHITFEKSQVVTMDSATVGIPRNSPDGYYEKVYWDVRISYGGAFVHAAPWSVGDQGRVNVSHGCVNLSTANATWFYYFSLRGDIVDVYNSTAPPDYADPGMADWNMTWKQWLAGDALPHHHATTTASNLPHTVEPRTPSYTATPSTNPSPAQTAAAQPTASHSPKPKPTPTKSAH